jgi:hypothetical protein
MARRTGSVCSGSGRRYWPEAVVVEGTSAVGTGGRGVGSLDRWRWAFLRASLIRLIVGLARISPTPPAFGHSQQEHRGQAVVVVEGMPAESKTAPMDGIQTSSA